MNAIRTLVLKRSDRFPVRLKRILSRCSSMILLVQRMPVVQFLFPEANLLGGGSLTNSISLAVTTVVGLGAYDSVAGATMINEMLPLGVTGASSSRTTAANAINVPATVSASLNFKFDCNNAPSDPKSWRIVTSGGTATALPSGLTMTYTSSVPAGVLHDFITGTPTQAGTHLVYVRVYEDPSYGGGTVTQLFNICALGFSTQPAASTTINSGTTTTLSCVATGVPVATTRHNVTPTVTYEWYQGTSGTLGTVIGTSSSFTTPTLTTTTNYWVRVKSVLGASTVYANSNTAAVTVTSPPSVSVAVAPTSVPENSGTAMVYTLTRTGATTGALTANYTVGGTATSGTDFPTPAGTVTFAAGSSTATVSIVPTGDTSVESDETVILNLATGAGYTLGTPSSATGTITNDDASLAVAVAPTSVLENSGTAMVYTITRTGATTGALTANYTVGGTATSGTDFPTPTGTVLFAAGSSTATVSIVPTGDTSVESDETVILNLATGAGYTLGTPSSATGTITNDDTDPYTGWASGLPANQRGAAQIPQQDGVTNLMKYACNLNPLAADVSKLTPGGNETKGLPAQSVVGGKIRMEFLRRKASSNPGISYIMQFGNGLDSTSWSSVDVSTSPPGTSINAEWERVTVDDSVGGTARFGRLKVVQP